jgi:hypothetical protein
MRCMFCGKEVRPTTTEGHGPGICAESKVSARIEEIDHDTFRLFQKGGQDTLLTREEVEHLARIMSHVLGWDCGPDLNLNPQGLPTRETLYKAVEQSQVHIPDQPELNRLTTALAILEEYVRWLPQEHSMRASHDLKFIARRAEELVLCYDMIRKFQALFRGQLMKPHLAQEMYSYVNSFVHRLMETTGVKLWD